MESLNSTQVQHLEAHDVTFRLDQAFGLVCEETDLLRMAVFVSPFDQINCVQRKNITCLYAIQRWHKFT